MKRSTNMPILTGGLPLVRSFLGSSRVVLHTTSFEGLTLTAEFDTRGLRDALKGHDFYCKSQWLSEPSKARHSEPTPTREQHARTAAMRREAVRSAAAELDGVTSVVWLGDGTLMLGMGGASNQQMAAAALDACDILHAHPDLPRRVEVQDTRATHDRTMRITCPG